MKTCILMLVSSLMIIPAFSQEEGTLDAKASKKLTREQKQEQKRIEGEETAKLVAWMVESRRFVLQADFMSNQTGHRIMVNSDLNFIIIDSSKVTIQIASTYGTGGPNSMGGVTTSGSIHKFEVNQTGKNKTNYSIRISTMTTIGSFDIMLMISPSANTDATITGIGGGKANYHGKIVPIEKARIYQAPSI